MALLHSVGTVILVFRWTDVGLERSQVMPGETQGKWVKGTEDSGIGRDGGSLSKLGLLLYSTFPSGIRGFSPSRGSPSS